MTDTFDRLATLNLGDLLAEIPGMLGFYPTDSLVILGLDIGTDGVRVAPVVRADLDRDRLAATAARLLRTLGTDTYIAVVISRDADADMFADMSVIGLRPIVTIGLDALETDTTYTLLDAEAEVLAYNWAGGRVGRVHASHSLRARLRNGAALSIDRAAALDRFAYDPDAVAPLALVDAAGLADDLLDALRDAPTRAARHRLYRDYATAWREADEDTLLAYALAACQPGNATLRDLFMADVCDDPDRYRDTVLAVARVCDGATRGNALCIYALQASDSDAMLAIDAAYDADPTNTLTCLLQRIRLVAPLGEIDLQSAFDAVRDTIA